MEEDWGGILVDFRSSDGCRWIVCGPVTPQDGLVTQDGLDMPPLWRLRADLFKKRSKSLKNASSYDFSIRALKLAANHEKLVFTFFAFLPPQIGFSCSAVPRKR